MDGASNGKTSTRPSTARRSASGPPRRPERSSVPPSRHSATGANPAPRAEGPVVGRLVGFDPSGVGLVDHPRNGSGAPLPARSVVPLMAEGIGREVVLMFENSDFQKPIIMGVVQDPAPPPPEHAARRQEPCVAELDGRRLVFTAEQEIVIRCGEASITLTRAGKILIRGAYVLSRSTGVNCLKGASVQIN